MKTATLVGAVVVAAALAAAPARAERALQLAAEGGVSAWSGPLGSALEPGGAWALRVGTRVTPSIALGVIYEGAANRISGAEGDPRPQVVRGGAGGFVRLSRASARIAPFLETGLAFSWLVASEGSGPEFRSDTGLLLPAAAGVMVRHAGLNAGLRLGYGVLFGNDAWSGGGGNPVAASLSLGAEF
jgi:hypothetical protein